MYFTLMSSIGFSKLLNKSPSWPTGVTPTAMSYFKLGDDPDSACGHAWLGSVRKENPRPISFERVDRQKVYARFWYR